MVAFIDADRGAYGVEPICPPADRPVAVQLEAREREPARQPARARRDTALSEHVGRVWRENREVYGSAQGLEATAARRASRRPLPGQVRSSFAPHSSQKPTPSRFSKPQGVQRIT